MERTVWRKLHVGKRNKYSVVTSEYAIMGLHLPSSFPASIRASVQPPRECSAWGRAAPRRNREPRPASASAPRRSDCKVLTNHQSMIDRSRQKATFELRGSHVTFRGCRRRRVALRHRRARTSPAATGTTCSRPSGPLSWWDPGSLATPPGRRTRPMMAASPNLT